MLKDFQKAINEGFESSSCLKLNEGKLRNEVEEIRRHFLTAGGRALGSSGKFKIVLIGESPMSSDTYLYNPSSKPTSFLPPTALGVHSKRDLLLKMEELAMIAFDLYPLPLPTFVYDIFDFCEASNSMLTVDYDRLVRKYYEESLCPFIDENTVFLIRYKKLTSRCEYQILQEVVYSCLGAPFSRDRFREVWSKGIAIDRAKLRRELGL